MSEAITRRGVLWLGLKCDVKCEFCYDELMPRDQKKWVPLLSASRVLDKFRNYYQDEYVDFMGGEPTLHPQIVDIVRHSANIGLRPTLVTHGMHLSKLDFASALRDAGVHDFLISVHGVGDSAHRIHRGGRDNFAKQLQGMDNLRKLGLPFRFNTIVIQDNLSELSDIAALAVETGARVVNFLTFNPYFEWSEGEQPNFQANHSAAAVSLKSAIDLLTVNNVEANVRYMPICTMQGYEKHVFTGYQLPYDTHEWDYNSWYDMGEAGHPDENWYLAASARQRERHGYVYAEKCSDCSIRRICDGVHAQYLERFGDADLHPYSDNPVVDPQHFIRNQPVVASEPSTTPPVIDESLARPLPLVQFAKDEESRGGVLLEISRESM